MMKINELKSKKIIGKVISNKMEKSITIAVNRLVSHPMYGKYIKKTTKLMVHDENNECKEGDIVEINPCRPISKNKVWVLSRIIDKSS